MRWLAGALLFVIVGGELLAATREHATLADGREVWISRPRDQQVVGLLIWLPRFDRTAKTDYRWWRRSGLVDQGIVVVVPSHRGLRWRDERDRGLLMGLRREWLAELDLQAQQLLIAGDGDGAQQAQAMYLGLPEYFGAGLLSRGLSAQIPAVRAGDRQPLGIFANSNDEQLPIRSLRKTAERIDDERFTITWRTALHGSELGPEVWELARQLFKDLQVPLAAAPAALPIENEVEADAADQAAIEAGQASSGTDDAADDEDDAGR